MSPASLRLMPALRHGPTRDLSQRAAFLWPGDEQMQRKWISAVLMVRSTRLGWVLDRDSGARSYVV